MPATTGNPRRTRRVVHRLELALNRLGGAPLVDVVDTRDDDDDVGFCVKDVAAEARADLVAALPVNPAIEHAPVRVRLHQPVRVLALDVAGSAGRRLDG